MPDPSIGDWETKAANAREASDRTGSPNAIRLMLEIAKCYDVLASEAGDYIASSQPGNEILNPD